jgi:hypothetical protein
MLPIVSKIETLLQIVYKYYYTSFKCVLDNKKWVEFLEHKGFKILRNIIMREKKSKFITFLENRFQLVAKLQGES